MMGLIVLMNYANASMFLLVEILSVLQQVEVGSLQKINPVVRSLQLRTPQLTIFSFAY